MPPRPEESVESWLEHLADANGLTSAQLLATIRRTGATTRYLTLAPSPETIARLAALARVDETVVYAATLASFAGTVLDLAGLDPADRYPYRQVAARGWASAHGAQICPACICETDAWKTTWRLLLVSACTDHGRFLAGDCPSCGGQFRNQCHSHLGRVGSAPVYGNSLGQGPLKQCQHDLTRLPRESASPGVLATQARIDSALAGHGVHVLGQLAEPAAYLADRRHLTTLLHLAGHLAADSLALWFAELALVAANRASTRGPRWGMRPPDHPALRGQALATADAILAADDLDAAATLLTPWTELTPTTNDGPLGWLADLTVMTPTLTRIVMTARAPHGACPTTSTPSIRWSTYADQPARHPPDHPARAAPRAPRRRLRLMRSDSPPLRLPVTGPTLPGHHVLGRGCGGPGDAQARWECAAPGPPRRRCSSPPTNGRPGSGAPSKRRPGRTTALPQPRSGTASG